MSVSRDIYKNEIMPVFRDMNKKSMHRIKNVFTFRDTMFMSRGNEIENMSAFRDTYKNKTVPMSRDIYKTARAVR